MERRYSSRGVARIAGRPQGLMKGPSTRSPFGRTKQSCIRCGRRFSDSNGLMKHMQQHAGMYSLPCTPILFSPHEQLGTPKSMPDGLVTDSYFPPVDEYWSKTNGVTATALEPLLPTPFSSEVFSDQSSRKHEAAAHVEVRCELLSSNCSCPPTDPCITEAVALLLGSLCLLAVSRVFRDRKAGGKWDRWLDIDRTASHPDHQLESFQFTSCLQKVIAPLLGPNDRDVSAVMLDLWQKPNKRTRNGHDMCSILKQRLNMAMIDPVDVFAPMQHQTHILLALHEYADASLQTALQKYRVSTHLFRSPTV